MIKEREYFSQFDPNRVPSPCFVIDKAGVEANLKILEQVQKASGAKILAALKAFACLPLGGLFNQYLAGICASGLHEAKLGREFFCGPALSGKRGEVHCFSPAFKDSDLKDIFQLSDHVVFNSPSQWVNSKAKAFQALKGRPHLKFGLRINPEHSEGQLPLYNPCAPFSRMGTTLGVLERALSTHHDFFQGISGLHFHTLCEQGFEPLLRTIQVVEEKFGQYLSELEWVNFGGGHHITREDYNVAGLVDEIKRFSERYGVQVYLEPGEAIVIRAGVLVSEVLDTTFNQKNIAVLDTSATCHMPDILEMPCRPRIYGAGHPDEKPHNYRLGGMTCLTGDVIGDYSFDQPLQVGQRLMFANMAHYTMVKTTTFNGINLPSIALWDSTTDKLQLIRQFGYDDFVSRLG